MKAKVQTAGRFLSGMIMPNIGAFIAWGLITALFIPTGWLPNERLAELVGPMIIYLLPLLIGYTAGKMTGGNRGAVVGAIATIGVVIGADIPMFMGAMIAGPIGGLCIKWFDKRVEGKIRAGFEMLVNNFSAGIIGGILAVFFFLIISPFVVGVNAAMGAAVQALVNANMLPLASIFVEPAKVLFLNNAINHGIFTPMGIEQAAETGRSIFFMIESNPGPGLGLLLAYMFFGKGTAKSSAPGAIIIHFFGGIHEIYFPYVLMNPILIIATIAGNATGIITLQVFGGGTVGAPSPGSVFAQLILTPRGGFVANILAMVLSAAVTLVLAAFLLKFFGKDDDNLEEMQAKSKALKAESKGVVERVADMGIIEKIVFACDAGMGSSAMGATTLRKKIKGAGITDVEVVHASLSELPKDMQLIVTHQELTGRAKNAAPNVRIVSINNFIGAPEYDTIVNELLETRK